MCKTFQRFQVCDERNTDLLEFSVFPYNVSPVTMGTYSVNRFPNNCFERLQIENMFSSDSDELIKSYKSEEKFLNNKLQQLCVPKIQFKFYIDMMNCFIVFCIKLSLIISAKHSSKQKT